MLGPMTGLLLAALKVGILAGGGEPRDNYHSHAVHVRTLAAALSARGVPPADVTIFWADGVEPAADRVVRARLDAPQAWLIEGTRLDERTSQSDRLENTTFPGYDVRPAKREALHGWLAAIGQGLGAGDTLALAVTDHGERDPDGGHNARITLWGEQWSVEDLRGALEAVPAAVRVVLWMSQCYSGGFADLYDARPALCGGFSANPDSVAYGCYPELAGQPEVGHFHRMVDALGRHASLAGVSDEVMLTDDLPDTPHLTSDAFLAGMLERQAEAAGVAVEVHVDQRLAKAPADAPERAAAAAIAARYGLGAVPTYRAALDQADALDALRHPLHTWTRHWKSILKAARQRAVERLSRPVKAVEDAGKRRALRLEAIEWMDTATRADRLLRARLDAMHDRVETGRTLGDRLDVQEAAALRVAYLYARLAGRLSARGEDRATLTRLQACEAEPVFGAPPEPTPLPEVRPMPPVSGMAAAIAALHPGFFGIGFDPVPGREGATRIRGLTPGGPAAQAGLRVGDVILAIGDWGLRSPDGLRESAALARPGLPVLVRSERDGKPAQTLLYAGPKRLPPKPLELGETPPDLELEPLGDAAPPAFGQGRPVVLFFWATWCKPCKAALPDLANWAAQRGADVIAITSEDAATVRGFLAGFGAFPFPIALDARGTANDLFTVEGTPTFVYLDARGAFTADGEGFTGQIPLPEVGEPR